MGRVRTQEVRFSYAVEGNADGADLVPDDPNTLPRNRGIGKWESFKELEPNSISSFSAQLQTVARTPISAGRQRRKGVITDLDSSVEFEHDLTFDIASEFLGPFLFADDINKNINGLRIDKIEVAANVGTVTLVPGSFPQFSTAEKNALKKGAVVYLYNFSNSAVNGLYKLQADLAQAARPTPSTSGAVTLKLEKLTIGPDLTGVSTGEKTGRMRYAGLVVPGGSGAVGDATASKLAYDSTTKLSKLTAGTTNTGLNEFKKAFTERSRPLVGQTVYVRRDVAGVKVEGSANQAEGRYGYAVVRAAEEQVLTLGGLESPPPAGPASAANKNLTQDMLVLLGSAYRNANYSDAAGDANKTGEDRRNPYLSRTYTFEALYPGLGVEPGTTGKPDAYQYARGCTCNQITFQLNLSDKAMTTLSFVNTDTRPPGLTRGKDSDDAPAVKQTSSSGTITAKPQSPVFTSAVNTSSDVARLRTTTDGADSVDFKSLTLTINNNATPEKVIGSLGARYFNLGTFEIDVSAEAVFTDKDLLAAVRDNKDVAFDITLTDGEGNALTLAIPKCTVGDGSLSFPVGESVQITSPLQAFEDPTLGYSIVATILHGVPDVKKAIGE